MTATPLTAPAHLCTTFKRLRDAGACSSGYRTLAQHIRDQFAATPEDFGMDRPIPVATILESNGVADAVWVTRNAHLGDQPDADRFLRLLGADFAEHVLHIFEKKYPDDKRPRECIEMTRRYANGQCSADDLVIARKAAFAARDIAWRAAAAAADAADAADAAAAAADAAYAAYAPAAYAARASEKQWQLGAFRAAIVAATSALSKEVAAGSEA